MSKVLNSGLRWLALSLLVLAIDQATKVAVLQALQPHNPLPVLPHFNLTLTHNYGTAMNIVADGNRWLLAGLNTVIIAFLLRWMWKEPARFSLLTVGLGLVVGGAIGNVFDRLYHGFVVDFLHFYWGSWSFYIFNVADAAITVGVGAILISQIFEQPDDNERKNADR